MTPGEILAQLTTRHQQLSNIVKSELLNALDLRFIELVGELQMPSQMGEYECLHDAWTQATQKLRKESYAKDVVAWAQEMQRLMASSGIATSAASLLRTAIIDEAPAAASRAWKRFLRLR